MSMMRLRCLPVRVGLVGIAGKVPGPKAGALGWTWAEAGRLAGVTASAVNPRPASRSVLIFMRVSPVVKIM